MNAITTDTNTKTAFDLYEHGSGGFVTFDNGESRMAVQLLALDKAVLKGETGTLIELEFSNRAIHISGTGLAEIFDHLLSGRLKLIRIASHARCSVENILLFEE